MALLQFLENLPGSFEILPAIGVECVHIILKVPLCIIAELV